MTDTTAHSGPPHREHDQPPPAVNGVAFLERVAEIMDRVVRTQLEHIARAADIVTESIRRGGVVQAFGTGHSEAIAMEIAGRAGGLIPTNRIALRDLALDQAESLSMLVDPHAERDLGLARRLVQVTPIDPEDVFVISSSSGINASIVELATLATEDGHPLIAITSLEHSGQVDSRHPSGQKLTELADVVLDNGAPLGDAVLPLPDGGAVCAVSTITSALLAQQLTAEVVRRLLDAGDVPPVYLSANVAGGDDHNAALLARYDGRIRRAT